MQHCTPKSTGLAVWVSNWSLKSTRFSNVISVWVSFVLHSKSKLSTSSWCIRASSQSWHLTLASSLNTHDFRFCGCLLVLWANMVGIALSFNNTLDRKIEIKIYHLTQKMEILVKTVIRTFVTFLSRQW